MITISNLAMQFGGSVLFKQVDLQFVPGNCYGIIGANGAGKSTFLKILSGELEATSGQISIKPGARMSVLKQDQNQYDAYTILDTVIMGNQHLYDVMKEKDALYEKPDFSEEDGMRASELEAEFADMDGWEAESDASKLLQGLGIPVELHYDLMGNTDPRLKVKVLLAQALFGKPDIVMLDEPTNNLDIEAINWLEDFILDYEDTGLVIVVSHDRHFLNTVCTHIVDIDYGKIKMYVGNYDFWYESSQLIQQLIRNKNKRAEEKIAELQTFIARFAANKAKSKQATSRRRLLDKMSVEEMPASSRRYPFVGFEREREVGKDILFVTDVSKTIDGVKLLDKVSFIVNKNDKIAFVGENELAQTTLFKILMGELEPDEGSVKWGQTVTTSYLPKDNTEYFEGCTDSLVDWIRQFSSKKDDVYLRGFLGRMLFSGEEVFKPVNVLSGGEKVRCMLSRMMLSGTNVLLLDQPTNHLDMHAVEWLEGYIEKFKGTVLTISHDRYFLDRVVTRIVELHDGKAEFYSGNYSFYVQEKQARFELQLKQYEKEQAKLAQLGFTLERMKGWGINNRTLYRRAMSIQHRMERIEKTDRPTQDKTMRAKFAQRDFFGDEVLSVKGLGKAYDGRTLFSDVELQVAGGERIALLGDNGTGKSTFLKILLGEEAGAGRIKFGPTVKWAYLPQIIHFAHPERTLLDTMLYEKNCTVQTARDRLGAYLFEGEDVFKTVGSLSGGEQSRLRLCMLMDEKINLLVLDEPTNHLDIDSREWLEDALEDYEGTLIFVSHDRYFVNKFATRIWELENGQIRDYLCGYEKYRSIKEKEAIAAPAPEKPKKEHKEKPKTSGSKMLEKKVRALEREIEKQEALSAELDAKIEAAAADYQELARLMEEKQQAEDTLAQMMEQWEAFSCELEDAT